MGGQCIGKWLEYNHQSTAVWNFDRLPWRGRPKFCMDIRIVIRDGKRGVRFYPQDPDWKRHWSDDSLIVSTH